MLRTQLHEELELHDAPEIELRAIIAALTAQLAEAKEAFKKLAAEDTSIDGYYQRAHDIAKEMLREDGK